MRIKIFRSSKWLLFATALLLRAPSEAQNVFVTPQTGKMIAAKSYDDEAGHKNGWNSLWRHNQLPITINVATREHKPKPENLKCTQEISLPVKTIL